MLFLFDARVAPERFETIDELWDIWEKEAAAAAGAKEAGLVAALYKVVGQRRVIGVLNVESPDQMDQILMAGLPMSHYIEFVEVIPVRDYFDFAADVKRRWK